MKPTDSITADAFLPDVIARYPATRVVFDRYGLHGCGGPSGPRERVDWFSRLHDVPLDQLLLELNQSASQPSSTTSEFSPSIADSIYRPFFLAGIVTVLTLGCMWGAINLFTIGLNQSFRTISYSWVLAHGHAMVFGFVGFFIMGFAYQAIPRLKHTQLWKPRLAFSSLPLMVTGIILQTVAHLVSPPWFQLEIASAIIQFVAVSIFAAVVIKTISLARKAEMYDRFVCAATGWFLIAAIANPIIFKLFELPANQAERLFNLATFNIPYRDVQLLGLAVVMILGVSLRFLPHAYGFREPSKRWGSFMFWGVNVAILAGVLSFLAGMVSGNHWLLTIQWLTTIVLLMIAIVTPFQYRMFGAVPANERDRGLKFIRAAHLWFILAMLMLVFTPIYNFAIYMPLTGVPSPFSHAFFGAYRHALTVGFIMMMIVGVSSKVVPTLSGVDLRHARSLWPTFVLLNVGNLTRVSFQIATDFSPAAYRIMGVSGFIEVVALMLWGYELFANMREGKRLEKTTSARNALAPAFRVTATTKVGDVLDRYPQAVEIFIRHGFTPLRNPVLRKTMARVVTIDQACRREGVEMAELLSELEALIEPGQRESATLISITRVSEPEPV